MKKILKNKSQNILQGIIILVLLLVLSEHLYADFIIKGKILGSDGKPLPMAQVHIQSTSENNPGSYSINADKDGNYQIKTNKKDIISLKFTGVYHNNYDFTLFLDNSRIEPYEININLEPVLYDDGWNPQLIGSFNEFSMDEGAIKMDKNKDGKFSAKIPKSSDTLIYQILFNMKTNRGISRRSMNGTQSDFYIYDGGGDYRSCIISNKKVFEIEFDPSKLYPKSDKQVISSSDESFMHLFDVQKKAGDLYYNLMVSRSKLVMERNYDKFDSNKNLYVDSLALLEENEKDVIGKKIILFEFFKAAQDGHHIDNVKNPKLKDYAKELLQYYKPESVIWSHYQYLPYWIVRANEDPIKSDYFSKLISDNPDSNVREYGVYNLLEYSDEIKDVENKEYYYNKFLKEFPYSNLARSVKIRYSKDKKIEIGKNLPEFKLANLDNSEDIITPAKLNGKFVMFDIWGTWCGPCLSEMKYLDSAYSKFKDNNFTIYSLAIDASPETVQSFRQKKWKMPWLHSFIPKGWNDDITEIFEVTGVPKCFLIDPNGKIIALDGELRGDSLFSTLSRVLK